MNNFKYYVQVNENGEIINDNMYTPMAIAANLNVDYFDNFPIPDNFKEIIFETADDVSMTKYQRLSDEISISEEDGKFYKKAIVIDGDEQYRSYVDTTLLNDAKNIRLIKLYQSDWTQVNDSPLSSTKKEEWKVYRQALRDITNDPAFPSHHKWPAEPQ